MVVNKVDLNKISTFDEDGIFRPEKLALVHVTNYMPQKVGDHYEIQSTAEATDYMFPRNTIHFTVGHHVDANDGGSWDDRGIMVVASLKDTIDANDKPLGMSAFDTFFETTPGHNLQLPVGTHLFVSTTDPQKLNGGMVCVEEDITYYKSVGFTLEEKKKIFDDMCSRTGNSSLDEDDFKKLPDEMIQFQLKQNLLDAYLEEMGYERNNLHSDRGRDRFNEEGSSYNESVRDLGEKLGCRFYSVTNKLDYYNSFTRGSTAIREIFRLMNFAEFILHLDEYKIVDSKDDVPAMGGEYTFERKDGKGFSVRLSRKFMESDEKDRIETLKAAPDYGAWMEETKEEEGSKWSPAFAATYDVWMEESKERLKHYYAEAKDYDFDEAWKRVRRAMELFDKGESCEIEKTPVKKERTKGLESLGAKTSAPAKKQRTKGMKSLRPKILFKENPLMIDLDSF